MTPDTIYRHGELLFDAADMLAGYLRTGTQIAPDDLQSFERALRIIGFELCAHATAAPAHRAAQLEAIEAGAARGVVVRMPARAHSDHLHGDGAVA